MNDYLRYKIIYPIKDFIKFIKKVYDYLPILWNDRDYDYTYIVEILQYKLLRTKKCIVDNDLIETAKETGGKIQEIIDLLEYVKYGYDENIRKMDEVFGKPEFIFSDENKEDDFLSRRSMITRPKGTPEEWEYALQRALYNDNKKERALINKAFGLLAQNIQSFWD